METLRFVMVLLLLVFVQVWGTLGTPVSSEEGQRDAWTVEDSQGYPLQRGLSLRLADLVKRSQQFHGLMGRKPEASQPGRLGRKSEFYSRNKGTLCFISSMS
uniref:Uncharacterized protein n=1 Tax=Gouania willdenowi TaxID=441366 RepID=A0A8C5NCY2_GOUWI